MIPRWRSAQGEKLETAGTVVERELCRDRLSLFLPLIRETERVAQRAMHNVVPASVVEVIRTHAS